LSEGNSRDGSDDTDDGAVAEEEIANQGSRNDRILSTDYTARPKGAATKHGQ
jgi:hypothetical protein